MSKFSDIFSSKKPPSQRPLRVGEEIRHALAEIFMRGECHFEGLASASITVSEVRVSPDLKNATAFVMPLGGRNKEVLLGMLKEASPQLRHLVSRRVKLRHVPRIHFALDNSFDEAARIESLLKTPEVARDLEKPADKE